MELLFPMLKVNTPHPNFVECSSRDAFARIMQLSSNCHASISHILFARDRLGEAL